jgi:two-component system, NtrC family, response regulator AtoC
MNNLDPIPELASDTSLVFGLGEAMRCLNATAMEIASTDIPVWILGESGTGKDVYARLLHRLSSDSDANFKKLSCSILDPAELLHCFKNDFPAGSQANPPGTLFFDGIDELDPACQRVLLSALPERQGRLKNTPNGFRIISSSCRNLEESVRAGNFRKELYFRINGICLKLPPLRERKEDIGPFLEHFLKLHSQELHRLAPEVDQETLDVLMGYDWPGNVRQLENLSRKMVALGSAKAALEEIRVAGSSPATAQGMENCSSLKTAAKAASKKAERELILQALERTRWNRKRAARELQISYKSLLYKIKQIGVPGGKLGG